MTLSATKEKAKAEFTEAAAELSKADADDVAPTAHTSVLEFYQALALKKLGQEDKAISIFKQLVKAGSDALEKKDEIDFFGKFGDMPTEKMRQAIAHYVIGLGRLGLGEKEEARKEFEIVLKNQPDHLGAKTALTNAMP